MCVSGCVRVLSESDMCKGQGAEGNLGYLRKQTQKELVRLDLSKRGKDRPDLTGPWAVLSSLGFSTVTLASEVGL